MIRYLIFVLYSSSGRGGQGDGPGGGWDRQGDEFSCKYCRNKASYKWCAKFISKNLKVGGAVVVINGIWGVFWPKSYLPYNYVRESIIRCLPVPMDINLDEIKRLIIG